VVVYLVRLAEPGRDAQRGKERRVLRERLRARLPDAGFGEAHGRLVLETTFDALAALAELHGVVSFSRCHKCTLGELQRCVVELARATMRREGSFRVHVRRIGTHPFTSGDKAAELGHAVRAAVPGVRVDLVRPDVDLGVEIRDHDCYVFDSIEPGLDHRARPAPVPPTKARFLVDQMLGRLRTWLRLIGVDAAGSHDQSDGELLAWAVADGRIVLTRDRSLARVPGVLVRYVQATDTAEQVREVVSAFGLVIRRSQLMSRCTFCNVPVEPIDKTALREEVPPAVFGIHERFFRCPSCLHVYWPGHQYARIVAAVGDLVRE
jgi:uncharacterized protein with PIN domain/tRNA(Ser,Leu) C12 N-acetylase TAN1